MLRCSVQRVKRLFQWPLLSNIQRRVFRIAVARVAVYSAHLNPSQRARAGLGLPFASLGIRLVGYYSVTRTT